MTVTQKLENSLSKTIDLFRKVLNKRYKIDFSVFVFFVLMSILMTYPMVFKLGTTLPDLGDPGLNAYLLGWHAESFRQFYLNGVMSPNFLYPSSNSLLYTDSFFFLGFIAGILSFFTNDPITMYNVLTIGSFIFSGFFAYLLAYFYTRKTLPSVLAGFIFAFAANKFGNLTHLQIISSFFIPLTFLFFEKFLVGYKKRDSFLFGLFLTLAGLISLYQFVYTILGLMIVLVFRIWITKYKLNWKKLVSYGAISLIPVIAILGPLYYQYYAFSKEYNISRSVGENVYYSSDLTAIFISSGTNVIYGDNCQFIVELGDEITPCYEFAFFPGLAVLFLVSTLIFVIVFRKKGIQILITKNREYLFYILTLVTIYIFSLGPTLKILGNISGIKLPYYIFYEIFIPAQGTRVPGRLSMIFSLFLGVFAGIAIYQLLKNKSLVKKFLTGLLICGVIFVEFLNIPLHLIEFKNPESNVFQIIKNDSRVNVVLSLPIFIQSEFNLYQGGTLPMVNSLKYNKRLVNGYSGFWDYGTVQFGELANDGLTSEDLVILRKLGVDTILVDKNNNKKDVDKALLTQIYDDANYTLYLNNADQNLIPNCKDIVNVTFKVKNVQPDKITVDETYTSEPDCVWISPQKPSRNYEIKAKADGQELNQKFKLKEPLFIPPNREVKKGEDLHFDRKFFLFSNKLQDYGRIEVEKN